MLFVVGCLLLVVGCWFVVVVVGGVVVAVVVAVAVAVVVVFYVFFLRPDPLDQTARKDSRFTEPRCHDWIVTPTIHK